MQPVQAPRSPTIAKAAAPDTFLVIPSEVQEWSEWDERHRRLRREGSGERVGRRTSQSLNSMSDERKTLEQRAQMTDMERSASFGVARAGGGNFKIWAADCLAAQ